MEGTARDAGGVLGRWHLAPSSLVPCFFGFAFMRAYNDLIGRRFSEASLGAQWAGEDLYSLVMLAVFLLCALFARRIAPLYKRHSAWAAAMLLAVAGAMLVSAAPAAAVPWPWLALAMAASAVAGALFILLWAELHACLDPLGIVTYVSGAFLLGTVGAWALQEVSGVREALVLAALPLASAGCLRASFARIAPVDLPRSSWGRYDFPWRLIVVLGVYEFAYGVREAAPSFQWDAYPLGVVLVALAVFLMACFFLKRTDFSLVYRTPFPLMICGLATVSFTASLGAFLSDTLVSAGYALMFLVLTFLLCDLSHRYGVSVLVLCGVQELTAVFRLAGHQVPSLSDSLSLFGMEGTAAVSALLTVMVVLVSGLLFWGRSSLDAVGRRLLRRGRHGARERRAARDRGALRPCGRGPRAVRPRARGA